MRVVTGPLPAAGVGTARAVVAAAKERGCFQPSMLALSAAVADEARAPLPPSPSPLAGRLLSSAMLYRLLLPQSSALAVPPAELCIMPAELHTVLVVCS